MGEFHEFLLAIENVKQRKKMEDILEWVKTMFADLSPKIGWNQPMFTDHGTYIIGFSVAKQHIAVAPEQKAMINFSDEIKTSGYDSTKMLFKIKWEHEVDYILLQKIIDYNIQDKSNCDTFWRK